MKPVSILVLSDAGVAGRELLARRDVELGWALNVKEAIAAIERRRPRVVLTREELALELLSKGRPLIARVPVVILLERDGWGRRADYFAQGATALVSAKSLGRILEAVTELTGLQSRYAPRVPYPEVVDVSLMGTKVYLEATELGTSGIAVRDLPPARVGDRVEVGLVMMDPPMVVSGLVVRSHVARSGAVTEIAFNGLDDDERGRIEAFVTRERGRWASFPDPVGLTSDLSGGTFTLDLMGALGDASAKPDRWVELLEQRMRSDGETRVPRWLARVERDLSEIERRSVLGQPAPAFARAAVEIRIDVARAQAALLDASSIRESCELALDFCRSLAVEAEGSALEILGQVPEIRAGVLSQVYGWTVSAQVGADHGSAAASA